MLTGGIFDMCSISSATELDRKYKLVAIDLDGTLLTREKKITPKTKDILNKAISLGTVITIATGRIYCSALPFLSELNLNTPVILHNGSLIKNINSGDELYKRPLSKKFTTLVKDIRKFSVLISAHQREGIFVEPGYSGKFVHKKKPFPVHNAEDITSAFDSPPMSLGIRGLPKEIDEVYSALAPKWKGSFHFVKSFPTFLEIHHIKASKGHALALLAKRLGILSKDVMAIGDGLNDYEMLDFAGCSVVMENAPSNLKNIADYVTCSNEEHGVAKVIEDLIIKDGVSKQ